MIVVSNTTPLVALATLNRFNLFRDLFGEIFIPQAVYSEAMRAGRKIGGAREEVQTADWVKRVTIRDQLAVNLLLDELDRGEAETIVLAHEIKADWVLMDEKKGRRKLAQLQIPHIGTVGLLLWAKQEGLLDQLQPELEFLRQKGFSLSQPVLKMILRQAQEG
jgi:predicted nucleic acid-binding protein